jgi:aminopeptidase YwaD
MTRADAELAVPGGDTMWAEFTGICDCGGRLSGTPSESRATALLETLGAAATGVPCRTIRTPYLGWTAQRGQLTALGTEFPCKVLVRSAATPPEGIEAEVIDLGRGTPDEFASHAEEIAGCIVLVRHELMFAAGTIHRRIKYQSAVEAGAVGFLIAGPSAGNVVAGSSGRGAEVGIPALGIAPETAAALRRRAGGRPRARIIVETTEAPAEAINLSFELPGRQDEWVVLSAHIDGHDIGESAIDNASGLAVALEVARSIRAAGASHRRGLRLMMFNVEEWALTGSAHYIASLTAPEREAIALNVNLDSVAGGAALTALTSGFADLEPFLLAAAEAAGVPLGIYRPLHISSDHANFARAGIPAFRLVAGFNDASAATRLVLTSEDTRDKVGPETLAKAAHLTVAIVRSALDAPPEETARWRSTRGHA